MTNSRTKSSRCATSTCVEVDVTSVPGQVFVYDEHKNMCEYTFEEWTAFVEGVKLGEFDLPA
jgi:hypothetical protein